MIISMFTLGIIAHKMTLIIINISIKTYSTRTNSNDGYGHSTERHSAKCRSF
jgi:hypothetical protein